MPMKEMTGQKFGRLTVIAPTNERRNRAILWFCQCSCGKEVKVIGRNLVSGNSKSCGCLHREMTVSRFTTHGHRRAGKRGPEIRCWMLMIQRCTDPNASGFKNYGGASSPVRVCDRWRHSFENFLADLGKRPSIKHSLSRFLDSGNYKPDNCEWGTMADQRAEAAGKRAMLAYRTAREAGKIIWRDLEKAA